MIFLPNFMSTYPPNHRIPHVEINEFDITEI